jgi:hypothetical protein
VWPAIGKFFDDLLEKEAEADPHPSEVRVIVRRSPRQPARNVDTTN